MSKFRDRLRSSHLAKNALWMTGGLGVRLMVQAAYFLVIARALRVEEYGAFVGMTSLVSILAPFATLGLGHIMVRSIARDPALFRDSFGSVLGATAVTGTMLAASVALLGGMILPNAAGPALAVIAASDLICVPIIEVSGQVFQAFQQLRWTAAFHVALSTARLIGAISLWWLAPAEAVRTWSLFYFGCAAIVAIVALVAAASKHGLPRFDSWPSPRAIAEAIFFSVSTATQAADNDLDKTLLARFGQLAATGAYAAAYRVIDVSFTPVRALLTAAYAKFFKHGESGIVGSFGFGRRIAPLVFGYGVISALALFLIAPALPILLGKRYAEAAVCLRWLALLPLLKSLYYVAGDTLAGAGRHRIRSLVQLAVVGFNLALNLLLIPQYSWRGAAAASLICDALLALGLWLAVGLMHRQASPALLRPLAEPGLG